MGFKNAVCTHNTVGRTFHNAGRAAGVRVGATVPKEGSVRSEEESDG